MVVNNALNISATGLIKGDGAGSFTGVTVTNHAPLVGAASNGITSIGPLTNGQLLIGNTSNDPSAATLTAGSGVSITNAAGSITIASVGAGLAWSVISADQTAVVNSGYFCNKGSLLTLTLPATTAVGDVIAVVNINGAAFSKILSANPGTIHAGSSTCTVNTGSLTSTALGDTVFLVAQTTASVWYWYGVSGSWTVA